MANPNEVYNSKAVPFGGLYVNVYRNQAAPALLGVYLLESSTPTPAGNVTDRPDVDGGDNGWLLVNGKREGPATMQIATAATPTLENGDFFLTSKFATDSGGNGVGMYFTIISPGTAIGVEYRKQSCTIRQDKFPDAVIQAAVQELV